MASRVNWQSSTGTKYLPMAEAVPGRAGWPGCEGVRPSSCWTLVEAYSCVPRKTTERGQSAKLRSWTWTFVPKVTRPTSALPGSRLRDWRTLSLSSSSSSCTRWQVSISTRKTGGPLFPLWSSYSTVLKRCTSSAGRFCSVMFSA